MHWQEKIYESLTEGKPVRDPHAPLTGALDHLNRYRTPPKGGWKEGGAAGEDERDKDRPHWRPRPGEDPTPPWRREGGKTMGKFGIPSPTSPRPGGGKGPKKISKTIPKKIRKDEHQITLENIYDQNPKKPKPRVRKGDVRTTLSPKGQAVWDKAQARKKRKKA